MVLVILLMLSVGLCEEIEPIFSDAVDAGLISYEEYEHLVGNCQGFEEKALEDESVSSERR